MSDLYGWAVKVERGARPWAHLDGSAAVLDISGRRSATEPIWIDRD